jgi:hypothetical protein
MRYADQALVGGDASWATGGIEAGTVGWDDGSAHYDTAAGEVVLVKVTLFRGRNPDRDPEPKEGRAGGTQILARVSAPMQTIPPDGAEVIVAVPAGFGLTPGAPVILAQVAVAPPNQFSASRSKLDFGPDVDVVIKARSVTITDYEDRFITVGSRFGIKMGDAGANGAQLKGGKWSFWAADSSETARGFLLLDGATGEVRLFGNHPTSGTQGIKVNAGAMTLYCQSFSCLAANGMLGGNAVLVQGVQYGPYPGIPSTSWFVAA